MEVFLRRQELYLDVVAKHLPYHIEKVLKPRLLISGQYHILIFEFVGQYLDASARRLLGQLRLLRALCLSLRPQTERRLQQIWVSLCEGAIVVALLPFNPFC